MEPQTLPGGDVTVFFPPGGGRFETPSTNSNAAGFSIVETIAARKRALSVAEFSELLGLGKRTTYDLIEAGKLPAYKIGGILRLDPKTTAAWLRSRLTTN